MAEEGPLESLYQHGDCSSSFIACYDEFRDFREEKRPGLIRFATTRSAWIAAAEPLTRADAKQALAEAFAQEAARAGKQAILMPVSREFAERSRSAGLYAIQVGSEAVFDLDEYFGREKDPIDLIPHARSLLKRGVRVVELDSGALSERHEAEIRALTQAWVLGKRSPLGFLNQVEPLKLREHKRIFAAFQGERMLAFVCANPVPRRNAFFFADYIRAAASRVGTIELLLIETMRLLRVQGIRQARFGLSALARLEADPGSSLRERAILRGLSLAFRYCRFPLGFKSLYEFKAKFAPSRWEPLYLVTDRKIGWGTLSQVVEVHLGPKAFLKELTGRTAGLARPGVRTKPIPTSLKELISRSALTLSLAVSCLALHGGRLFEPTLKELFSRSAYVPGQPTLLGALLGPFFHNGWYHLGGDLLTLIGFGAAVEVLKGRVIAALVIALGLWASNPLTHALVAVFLPDGNPEQWKAFLSESDYGSSNAAYAVAGAIAALTRVPGLILIPFALNGILLCLARGSWLSLHHLVGLALGYACLEIARLLGRRDSTQHGI